MINKIYLFPIKETVNFVKLESVRRFEVKLLDEAVTFLETLDYETKDESD